MTMDEFIRAGAARTRIEPGESLGDAHRRHQGREQAPAQASAHPSASEEQKRAAELAGLPLQHAHRITGEGPAAVADARSFRAALQQAGAVPPQSGFDGGAGQGVPAAPDMNQRLREGIIESKTRGDVDASQIFPESSR